MAGAAALGGAAAQGGAATAGSVALAGQGGASGAAGSPAVLERGQGPGSIHEVVLEALDRPVQRGNFSLYVPSGVTRLSGVIVHQHGCGRSGITMPRDLHWQALANQWGMALMGSEFPTLFPDGDHCDRWSHVQNGSDALFVAALSRFATDTGHQELASVPWVLWGHSGGASWAFQMAKKYASNVAAVVMKSICEADTAFEPSLTTVPFLLATGPEDLGSCYPITTEIFHAYRAQGAPWAYVDEPQGTHDCAKLRYLAIPYLDATLQVRLNGAPANMLNLVNEETGYLGDNVSITVSPAATYAGDAKLASWLPSSVAAAAWREFVTTRDVLDTTPPAQPPRLLTQQAEGAQARLRWLSEGDLDSGVSRFNVYQDGTLLLSVPEQGQRFQGYNYGDEPDPVAPEMTAVVPVAHSYRITLLNGAGLESARSEPLAVP